MFRLYLFLVCLLIPQTVFSAEVIHNYDVRVEIQDNGMLNISEKIEVTAEGNDIRRGIYRDFPLFRRTFLGGRLATRYKIQSVTRDGKAEPWHTETNDDNGYYRLYVGESSVYLTKGKRYKYEIKYTVAKQVFFFDGYDELNWNVISADWKFPIENASAEIVLPRNANVEDYSVYTGKVLSKGTNYTARNDGNVLRVKTNTMLYPKEGVTVAVSFPKGYVSQTYDMVGVQFFWKQHPGIRAMILGLLILCGYYYWIWTRVGKDPKSKGLAPFYTPPKGISPAMAAVINTMGDAGKEKTMSSAIISLASKGYFEIKEKSKRKYVISRVSSDKTRPEISEDEQIIYDFITSQMTVSSSSEALVEVASEHRKKLKQLCRKKYFLTNIWWWLGGMGIFIATLLTLTSHPAVPTSFWFAMLFVCTFGGISAGVMFHALKTLFTGSVAEKGGSIFLIIWASGFSIGGFMGFFLLSTMLSWLVIALMVLMGTLVVVMQPIMKAPTYVGRRVMDHIDGLKYYMEAVEEKVLKKFNPPEMSRELYEKYLPYAVALDVESKWADKFALAVGASTTAVAKATTPHWYRGSSSSGSFSASSMVSNFGSTLSAASSSNSSSSGGGSSGGGGGGGGGGGW